MFRAGLLLLVVMVMLAGCAGMSDEKLAAFSRDNPNRFPVISVYLKQPSDSLAEQCESFDEGAFSQCRLHWAGADAYVNALRRTRAFNRVLLADEAPDYQLNITSAALARDSVADFSEAIISGLSLLAVPDSKDYRLRAEVDVTWRNALIKRYEYDLEATYTTSLFHSAAPGEVIAEALIPEVMSDIERDGTFSPSFLARALDSTDYASSLDMPSSLGGMQLFESRDYRDPMLGAVRRYGNPDAPRDVLDVFVYPVRQAGWADERDTLQTEIERTVAEIRQIAERRGWTSLAISQPESMSWADPRGAYSGLFVGGTYRDDEGNDRWTTAYVFLVRDKIVKFRTTFPAPIANEYVRRALPAIGVPPESPFMAAARQASLGIEVPGDSEADSGAADSPSADP